jgi:hypothetical protein
MLRKIHGTNFIHIKFLDRPNIKCQNRPVLPPAQVFYFNGQALHLFTLYPRNSRSVSKVRLNAYYRSTLSVSLSLSQLSKHYSP